MEKTTQTSAKTRDIARIALGAALITVCSWIAIPTAIPFTLQTLGVFLTVGLLGGRRGTLTVLVYLLLGAVGLPVLGGFTGGLGIMLSYTGGYLFGFLAAALVMWALEGLPGPRRWTLAAGMLLGQAVCYFCGVVWFMLFFADSYGMNLGMALGYQVVPFLLPDLVKIFIALALVSRLSRYVR